MYITRPLSDFGFTLECEDTPGNRFIADQLSRTCDYLEKNIKSRAFLCTSIPLYKDINITCQMLNGKAYLGLYNDTGQTITHSSTIDIFLTKSFANVMKYTQTQGLLWADTLERSGKVPIDREALMAWIEYDHSIGIHRAVIKKLEQAVPENIITTKGRISDIRYYHAQLPEAMPVLDHRQKPSFTLVCGLPCTGKADQAALVINRLAAEGKTPVSFKDSGKAAPGTCMLVPMMSVRKWISPEAGNGSFHDDSAVKNTVRSMVRKALAAGCDVVYTATNLSRGTRDEFLRIARDAGAGETRLIYMDTKTPHLPSYLLPDDGTLAVWRKLEDMLVEAPPQKDAGWDSITVVPAALRDIKRMSFPGHMDTPGKYKAEEDIDIYR